MFLSRNIPKIWNVSPKEVQENNTKLVKKAFVWALIIQD